MPCLINKDQPIRVRLSKTGVIHAAAYRDYGGFTQWTHTRDSKGSIYVPRQKRLQIACRWGNMKIPLDKFIVPNTTPITCKSCMKQMGMVEGPVSPKRYVVRNIKTGEFMKNTSSRCSGWSDSLTDAFFFRTEYTAKDKCKVYRHLVGDELMTYAEWVKAGQPKFKSKRMYNTNLEIRVVKFTLED